MIHNFDDLKKVYYHDYPIEDFVQRNLHFRNKDSIKMIKPLSPIKNPQKIVYDQRKMERRNTIESEGVFNSDAYASLSSSAESMKEKKRQQFKAYQHDLMKQIEEKQRRLAQEKQLGKQLDSYYSKQGYFIDKRDEISKVPSIQYNPKQIDHGVGDQKRMMIAQYEELFKVLFQQQKSLIEEYKNEVNMLKSELYELRKANPNINTNGNDDRNYTQEETQEEIEKNILYKSKYENCSLKQHDNSNELLLPTKSKLVKKIGERHLIETWRDNPLDSDNLNFFTTLPKDNDNEIPNEENIIINSINTDSSNELIITIPRKHHKDYNLTNSLSLNSDPIPEVNPNSNQKPKAKAKPDSKSAMRYVNTQSSESTYYNPLLANLNIDNQFIDFSRNDSSNIETDSENLHTNFIIPHPINTKERDSFHTKITYFENNSQIVNDRIIRSSKEIPPIKQSLNPSDDPSSNSNNEGRLSTVYNPLITESNGDDVFNNSLNTFNEHMQKEESTLKRIQAYTMNINGTTSSSQNTIV